MNLRSKRSAHPGYIHTGGPPQAHAAPGTKTKKEVAAEEKAQKVKAKAEGMKKIARIERANTAAYANDETPRPRATQTSSCGHNQSKEREPSSDWTVSPSELSPELTSMGSDPENIETPSDQNTDDKQPHESDVPSIGGSELEPPTDLERTIKKKSKGKSDVRTFIEDLKKGDEEDKEDEDTGPQETPAIARSKRLRTEGVRDSSCPSPW